MVWRRSCFPTRDEKENSAPISEVFLFYLVFGVKKRSIFSCYRFRGEKTLLKMDFEEESEEILEACL